MDNCEINNFAKEQLEKIKVKCKRIRPVVAIQCLTYNHELYIRDALEGFAMQKTDFPFVAIVHDDASTDRTAEIVREYADKYPDIILPIYEKDNQYSKKNGSLSRVLRKAFDLTGTKYIALCEGDDYWIDPLKLQKQVDFLEAHGNYSLCFHTVNVITMDGCNLDTNCFHYDISQDKDYSANEIIKNWTIPTCSVVYRFSILKLIPNNKNFQYGDNVVWLTCATHGRIRGIKDSMGVYRRNAGAWTAQNSMRIIKMQLIHYQALKESFPMISSDTIDPIIKTLRANIIFYGLKNDKKESIQLLCEGLRDDSVKTIVSLMKLIKNYFKQHFCRNAT